MSNPGIKVLWAGLLDGEPSRVVRVGDGVRCERYDKSSSVWVRTSFDLSAPFVNPPASRKGGGPYGCWFPPES